MSGGAENPLIDLEPDANFTNLPFDFSQPWVGAVVEDFSVHMEFDFILTPKSPENEITIPLLLQNGVTFPQKFGPFDLDWTFDPILHGWVNSSAPANFSYGFKFMVPNNSAIWIPVDPLATDLGNVTTVGFSNSQLTPLNYTSPNANDNFAFELSFRPIFKVSGSFAGVVSGLTAEVFADVPKLDIAVSQVANVTRDCQVAKPGTPSEQIFHNLTHVVPYISFDYGFNGSIASYDIPTKIIPIGNNNTLPTSCLDFLPSASALGPVPDSSDGLELRLPLTMMWATLTVVILGLL